MRTPFRLLLALCALLALLANPWLFVALVLLFGRAAFVQRRRNLASAAVARGQRELPGDATDAAPSPLEILPFP